MYSRNYCVKISRTPLIFTIIYPFASKSPEMEARVVSNFSLFQVNSLTHLVFSSLRVLQVEEVEEEGSIEQNLEPTDLDEEKEEEKRLQSAGFPGPPANWVNTKNVGLQVGSWPQHLPQHHPITSVITNHHHRRL